MRSNYKKIGDYIREVNNRNVDLGTSALLGINIDKFFMPSVANVIGTDMAAYKVIKRGQFACNRMHVGRDYRLPIALSNSSEDFIVSPAYDVFEVIGTEKLLPEYLMMWFSRKEFDRNAWFYTDADVRGGLSWKAFCDMELPIPFIDKQKEIVKEYNVLLGRIKLNNRLIQKLEETAQAIYKQWFVNFDFPDENGKPYRASGGEMEFNEELEKEIPKGWKISKIGIIANVIDCLHTKKPERTQVNTGFTLLQIDNIADYGLLDLSDIYYINKTDYKNWTSRIEISEGDCIITNVGKDAVAKIPKGFRAALGRNMTGIRLKENFPFPAFLIQLLVSDSMKKEIEMKKDTGTILESLNVKNIPNLNFILGPNRILTLFESIISPLRLKMEESQIQASYLKSFREILLSKLATINN